MRDLTAKENEMLCDWVDKIEAAVVRDEDATNLETEAIAAVAATLGCTQEEATNLLQKALEGEGH